MIKHKFKLNDSVLHKENGFHGMIVGRTTLELVVDGDCSNKDKNDPWYVVQWVEDCVGQESEDSIELDQTDQKV